MIVFNWFLISVKNIAYCVKLITFKIDKFNKKIKINLAI